MTHTTPRPSLRWTLRGTLTEDGRAAIARLLDCPFTDEDFERPGVMAAPDVTFVAAPDGDELRIIAHFNHKYPPFSSTLEWLHERVERAAINAGLPAPELPVTVDRD